jgi:large subunit ribosomal protein L10
MPTEAKAHTIERATDWYKRSKGVLFADYRGVKVKELQDLRAKLRLNGGEIHVIKNTLFRQAAGDDAAHLPSEAQNGPTAVAFIYGSESEAAKTILDYAKTNKKLVVKGGFIGGRALTAPEVEALSQLPPKEILIAQVIGAIAAPLTSLVGVIEALYADPIRVIGAVADKVAEG